MTAEPIHIPNATPFDLISESADDFLIEAGNFADGEPVQTQAQADTVSRLIEEGRNLAKAADEARKEENRPFDEAKAKVQAKYAPLFAPPTNKQPGKVFVAIDALKATLAPFLRKLDEEKREAERLAREAADKAARDAAEAMRQANAADLAAREEAEAKVKAAEDAQRAASAASKDKAHATGGTRAMGLRTRWVATVTDAREAAAHYWRTNPDAFLPILAKLAQDDANAGKRSGIPGVSIVEERTL